MGDIHILFSFSNGCLKGDGMGIGYFNKMCIRDRYGADRILASRCGKPCCHLQFNHKIPERHSLLA